MGKFAKLAAVSNDQRDLALADVTPSAATCGPSSETVFAISIGIRR